jgi:Fe-S-cluster containining protein
MEDEILSSVREFNKHVKLAIDGPNCIDPKICDGNCCFIQIDVPRALIKLYISERWADISEFHRGSTFSFEINVDLDSLRCVFYDKKINGCGIHNTGMKPCQCWVYPTGLDAKTAKSTCKKAEGWKIIDEKQLEQANQILIKYVELCKKEAEQENTPETIKIRLLKGLPEEILKFPPHSVAGVIDGLDSFSVLQGEGYNIGLRNFCSRIECNQEYFTCPGICKDLQEIILKFLQDMLPSYIAHNGFKGEYSILELKNP